MILVCLISLVSGELDCPSDLCTWAFIGDGECDLGCMLPACNYDSSSTSTTKLDIFKQSDCYATCTSVCSEFLLGNNKCDTQCNTEACSFDLGDCGYCASGCLESDLSLSSCKPECETLSCRYGDNTCGWCAESCFQSNLGDGICQEECKVETCDYDEEDCPLCSAECEDCSGNCEWSMIGDGTCDDDCNIASCGFDELDCICGNQCKLEDRNNTDECLPACDFKNCDWQNGTCGYCASGCFQEMLSNGQCDQECYTEDCNYDEGECGCAVNCLETDLGTCKDECLVESCDWDPDCGDQVKKLQAIAFQLDERDFTKVFKYDEECEDDECSLDDLVAGYNMECRSSRCEDCLGQLGGCSLEDNNCPPRCERCSNKHHDLCLECDNESEDKHNEFGECVQSCSIGHVEKEICLSTLDPCPNDKVYHLCVNEEDSSSAENPVVFTVDPDAQDLSSGTVFLNLEDAFENIWNQYTVLRLKSTVHVISEEIEGKDEPNQSGQYDHVNLTIETDCADPCTNKAVILLLENNIQFPQKFASLTIKNIIFDGSKSLKTEQECIEECNDCTEEYCKYCPYTISSGDSLYNDRDEEISEEEEEIYNIEECSREGKVLFEADYDLNFEECEVKEYRQNQSKFIHMKGYSLTIKNTDFFNVMSNGDNSAFILVECEGEETCTNNFQMIGGSVSYVNNGYEYHIGVKQRPFLSIQNINSVLITDVQFSYNTVLCDVDDSCNSFISIEGAFKTAITRCEFTHSFFMDSVIGFDLNHMDADNITIDSDGQCVECSEINVYVHNNKFSNLGSTKQVIDISETNYVANIVLSNNEMNSVLTALNLMKIEKTSAFSNVDLNGGFSSFIIDDSKKSVYLEPKFLKIENNSIENSFFESVLYLANVPNISVDGNSIKEIIESPSLSSALESYMEGEHTYLMNQITELPELNLINYFSAVSSSNLSITGTMVDKLICQHQPCLLDLQEMSDSISIINLAIASINSTGTSTAIVLITGGDKAQLTLENFFIIDIENAEGSEIMKISQISDIDIKNLIMTNILSHSNGGLLIEGALNVRISDSTWQNVTTDNGSGGCIGITMSGQVSDNTVSIDTSSFEDCGAISKGGAIYLSQANADKEVDLQIASSNFTSNFAHTGSILFITDSVIFSDLSTISNCTFKGNIASVSGGIDTVHTHGILNIDNCTFSENSGSGNSVQGSFNVDETLLKISRTSFLDNQGYGAISIASYVSSTTINTENCIFQRNDPLGFFIITATWNDIGSEFSENTLALILQIQSIANLSGTLIYNNDGNSEGSVCTVSSSSSFSCTNCQFLNNKSASNGGALAIETSSVCNLDNCLFQNCESNKRGSALSFANTAEENWIRNSQFISNLANEGGTVNVVDSKVSFDTVTFSGNTAAEGGSGIIANSGDIFLDNGIFKDQEGNSGVFIHVTTESNVQVSNSEFSNSNAEIGGMISLASSVCQVSKSSFTNGYSFYNSGAIYAYSMSNLEVYESTFEDITSGDESGHVSIESGSLHIENSSFKNLPNGGIVAYSLDELTIKSSTFESGNRRYSGTGVYAENSMKVQIESCSFTGLTSEDKGGAVYLLRTLVDIEDSFITNCVFNGNTAGFGGALYLDNVSLHVSSSSFTSNTAHYSGGGVYLSCNTEGDCEIDIYSSTLTGNTCSTDGGGIAWEVKKPNVYGNTYSNNQAMYGDDIASFPIKIVEYSGRMLAEKELASGQLLEPPIVLALLDHYDQVVASADGYTAQLSVIGNNTALKGETLLDSVSGIFNFSDVYVTAEVNTEVELTFSSTSLESIASIDADQVKESSITFSFESRECQPGEYYFLYECTICEADTYSLKPEESCTACPSSANCDGRNKIYPKPGYWRKSDTSETIYECFNPDACQGGYIKEDGTENLTGECSEGYRGHLCQACENGYSRTSKNRCGVCPETSLNVLILISFTILVVGLCFVMIRSSLRSAYQTKALHSIYIKIFVNYMQLVMLTAQFRLDWPEEVMDLLQVQEQSGQVTDQFFSIDCFLATEDDDSYIEIFYSKLAIIAFLPLMLGIAALSFWGIYAWVERDRDVMKQELITTLCVLFFLIHPTITRFMFSMFACQKIEGDYWLLENLDIQCWTERHVANSLMIGLPSIIIWVIGIPALILGVLSKRKAMLKKTSEKLKFGFLYNGYRLDHYYWEFVVLYRKVAIISCAVFLSSVSIPIQALICFTLLVVCLHMQYTIKPYDRKELNQMENRAIIVATITIYCGLYFLTDDLSDAGKLLFFVIMVAANIYFLVFWLYFFCNAALVIVSKFVPALRDKVKGATNVDRELLSLIKNRDEEFDSKTLQQILSMSSSLDFYKMIMHKRLRKPIHDDQNNNFYMNQQGPTDKHK